MRDDRITANAQGESLTFFVPGERLTASLASRTLSGTVVVFGEFGNTSKGRLKVRPGALRFPQDLSQMKLTKEHDRGNSRGHGVDVQVLPDRIRASMKVSDGPEGDDALREAGDRTRDNFSFDVINAEIEGDEIVAADVVAIGQVGIPAFTDSRIDQIAASQTGENMTPEQRARLVALRALASRTPEEETEMAGLVTLETANPETPPASQATPPAAPAAAAPPAAAAAPAAPAAVPTGVPVAAAMHTPPAGIQVQESALDALARNLSAYFRGERSAEVTAALQDITQSGHMDNVAPESWSGELWSGVEYVPEFLDLFVTGNLDAAKGKGWRWVTKPAVGDYAGDKADIPSNLIATEPSEWAAFRLAGGWDIDRIFFDLPDSGFIKSFFEAVREDIAFKRDMKVKDYILAQAVAAGASQTSLLKAARVAVKHVKRNTRQAATFVLVNDDDFDDLFDVTNETEPAFLELLGVKPEQFRPSQYVTQGQVLAGVKNAAKVRWLGGASPIRVEAQNLTKAGIDEAFFTYGAIEEHHETGIVKVAYDPTP